MLKEKQEIFRIEIYKGNELCMLVIMCNTDWPITKN